MIVPTGSSTITCVAPTSATATCDINMRATRGRTADGRPFREAYGPWAVVTGASSGIGEEFARQLAWHGCNVVAVARREDRLQSLCSALKSEYDVQTRMIRADLSAAEGLDKVKDETAELDVGMLVNNAGLVYAGEFNNADGKLVQSMLDVNVVAVTHLAHIFGDRFKKRGSGGILFLSSASSLGSPYMAVYSSTKSFVTCLSYTLGVELAPHVQCMALEPGFVKSEMTDGSNPDIGLTLTDYPGIISAEECVDEALMVFGKRSSYTPGFVNRFFFSFLSLLPRSFRMALLLKLGSLTS